MMKTEEVMELYANHVVPTYSPRLVLTRGKGVKVWDTDGKVYLDFLAGISVLNVGHSHPKVVREIQEQAAELMHVSNIFYNENQARLAWKLSDLSLGGKCFFCNSGAEANEALIKLARLWGHDAGKYEVITMHNSFHGRTLATAAATGQTKVQKGFEPMPSGFVLADFNDLDSVAGAVTDKTAAILVEAVQGEGGVIAAEKAFMEGLRALCDERDLLLLCDEIQCGMGRTGKWFGYQHSGVEPDAFSLAKALGAGFPIGALVTSPKVADVFQPGTHASTFGGTPLACAAALAAIDVMEEEYLVRKAEIAGRRFVEGLQPIIAKYEHVVGVRNCGLMVGLLLDQSARPLVDRMMEMGLIALETADTVVRFLPPLNVLDPELEEALEIIDEACEEWHQELSGEAPARETGEDEPEMDMPEPADDADMVVMAEDLMMPEEEESA